jgi:phosphoglycolate phosphatase
MKMLIFDLDGTLIDSKRDIVSSVNEAFLQLGFPVLPEDRVGDEIGRGSAYLFRRLLGEETPANTIHDLVDRFKANYQDRLLDHTRIYPGILDTLLFYKTVPKVVVTNKNQIFADQIIDGLGLREHFEGVFGSEAFASQKPDPGPIWEVCKRWNVHPSEAVVIGDSSFDVTAGKAAGARTVAVLYGYSQPGAFQLNPPDVLIDSAEQLMGLR